MTDAVMFDPTGKIFFPQQYYTKEHSRLRGSFRPVTKVNMDMYEKSLKIFKKTKLIKTTP
jgi:hypothetical protein